MGYARDVARSTFLFGELAFEVEKIPQLNPASSKETGLFPCIAAGSVIGCSLDQQLLSCRQSNDSMT
jgi:hypothetical protein